MADGQLAVGLWHALLMQERGVYRWSALSCPADRSTCCHGAKSAKLTPQFYVKAAGNVSSVQTDKARRGQQQWFGRHNRCIFCTITVLHKSKRMGLSGPCRPRIVAAGPRQVAGLSRSDEGSYVKMRITSRELTVMEQLHAKDMKLEATPMHEDRTG
jgi:hypothetical protein